MVMKPASETESKLRMRMIRLLGEFHHTKRDLVGVPEVDPRGIRAKLPAGRHFTIESGECNASHLLGKV